MKNSKFCHLHVHGSHSYLDGLGTVKQLTTRAKELGFTHLAYTNHGNIDGLIQFQKACDDIGLKPVLGCEMYIVPKILEKNKDEKRGHIILLVKNQSGWKDLCKMLTKANIDGFYYKPRIDYDMLLSCDLSGLVILTACIKSFVYLPMGEAFLWGLVEQTKDVYIEIMPHCQLEGTKEHNERMSLLKMKYGLKFAATNDVHYLRKEDYKTHEVLLAMQTKARMSDNKRWKFEEKGLHLRTANEMISAFSAQGFFDRDVVISALKNTIKIAEKCESFRIPKHSISLPAIFKKNSDDDYLSKLCEESPLLKKKKKYLKRMKMELKTIKEKKFSRYFLIVWDLVKWCKNNDILVGCGRGSVGGSLCAYLIGITTIDPIKYGLLFSRFINKDRIDFPDIDLDFEHNKRGLVIDYLKKKYGEKQVAGVSTFLTMQGRAVVRDVARVFDIPLKDVNSFTKAIFVDSESESSLGDSLSTFEGKLFQKKYPEVIEHALKLEGQEKSCGQHAAAVVVSPVNLYMSDRGNLCVRGNSESKSTVINWEMSDVDYVGLMKLDILGLNTLTILNEAKRLTGKVIDFAKIKPLNKEVFAEMSKGETVGIFQMSTPIMTETIKRMGISNFNDMAASLALVRPGPLECVTGDTIIRCWTGAKMRIDEIDEGRFIPSSSFAEGKGNYYVKNRIRKIVPSGIKDIYEIQTSDGKRIRCSLRHRFFAKRQREALKGNAKKQQYEKYGLWRELKDLKVGDLVLTRNLNKTNSKGSKHAQKLINSSKHVRFQKGHKTWNKGMKKYTKYSYGGKRQTDRVEKRRLALWLKDRKDHPEKYKEANIKMRQKLKKIWNSEKRRKIQSERMIEYYGDNLHPNSKGIVVSKPQMEIFKKTKECFKDAIIEYRFDYQEVNGRKRFFFLDIAIPSLKINIEYDGGYWHKVPGLRIEPRDSILEKAGWKVLRVIKKNKKYFLKNVRKIVVPNSIKFSKIVKIIKEGREQTYDIVTENQDFPNYIANDFIVHNSKMTENYILRKNGQKWERKHPVYEEITKDTYGVVIYQEQVMQVINKVAGLSYSVADEIRKVIGKKRHSSEFEPYRKKFLEGCEKTKIFSGKEAQWFWDMILKCARYLFNKSHAVEYAMLAYWTAYFKHKYPKEFITACLTYGSEKKKDEYIREAKRMGIAIMPPKIGLSDNLKWKIVDDFIYVPFIEIKGMGEKSVKKINQFQKSNMGFFSSDQQAKGKVGELLNAVGAFSPNAVVPDIGKYFSFNIGSSVSLKKIPFKGYSNKEKLSECKSCVLRKECSRPVMPCAGRYNVAIIGESPGGKEEQEGIPFIGKAGKLLFDTICKYGAERHWFHVTNVCKCYPSKTKTPERGHINACSAWLKDELESIQCGLILSLGATSLYALTGQEGGIMNMNGKLEYNNKTKCMVMYGIHPAAVLRDPNKAEMFNSTVKSFVGLMKGGM